MKIAKLVTSIFELIFGLVFMILMIGIFTQGDEWEREGYDYYVYGFGIPAIILLFLFGILGLCFYASKKEQYVVADHPFKPYTDKVHLILYIVLFVEYFGGLIAGTVLCAYYLWYLFVYGIAIPMMLVPLFHLALLLIEYHHKKDYLKIEEVEAIENLK